MLSLSRFSVSLAAVCAAALGVGCTQPQSGLLTRTWCQPAAGEAVMLDDMEDGDAIPCDRKTPHWMAYGLGALIPGPGEEAKPVELPVDDAAWSRTVPSFRSQYLHGSLGAGGYGSLVLPLGTLDLSPYQEIDFWARSDSRSIDIRVAVMTASASNDDYFGVDAVTISPTWGEGGNAKSVNNIPLLGALSRSDGTFATAADLVQSNAIVFQFQAPGGAADFGLWIDDVQLKLPSQ